MSDPREKPDTPGFGASVVPEDPQSVLDHQLFHLKALYEASSALAVPVTPGDILKTFLRVTMGPLGLAFGFGIVLHVDELTVESIGLEQLVVDQYRKTGFNLVHKFFPGDRPTPTRPEPAILVGEHLRFDPNLPEGTSAVIGISMSEESHAVLGFGPKISGEPYSTEETELLQSLVSILAVTLKKSHAAGCIRDLNTALKKKNERIQQALAESELAQEDLARHAFELQALYETTLELTDINAPEAMLDTFVLSLMGTLSYASGWIGLYGPDRDHAEVAYRGPDPEAPARLDSAKGREAVLAQFVALKDRMPQANHSCLLEDDASRAALPAEADVAVLFALDHGWQGAIGLSAPLSPGTGEPRLDKERKRLLLSLVGTFMVALGNARQLHMIREMNTELAARNRELQATLDELTSAKHEIDVQTEAKERIVGLVHGEVDRVWRASWRDVGLILLAGLALGFLFNFSSPEGIRIIPESLTAPPTAAVGALEAERLTRTGKAVIIDARPGDFFIIGHIPGAINLPEELFDFVYSMKLSELEPDVPLLVYGRTISRHYDADVARELILLGHEHVMLIDGGLSAWEDAGLEVAK
jgi:rhodanese-related sulfurtransferase